MTAAGDYYILSNDGSTTPCNRRFLEQRWTWFAQEFEMLIVPIDIDETEVMIPDSSSSSSFCDMPSSSGHVSEVRVTPHRLELPIEASACHLLLIWLEYKDLPDQCDPIWLYELRKVARNRYGLGELGAQLAERQQRTISSPAPSCRTKRSSMQSTHSTRSSGGADSSERPSREWTPPATLPPSSPLPALPTAAPYWTSRFARSSLSLTESEGSFEDIVIARRRPRVVTSPSDQQQPQHFAFGRTHPAPRHPPLSPSQKSTDSHSVLEPIAQSPSPSMVQVNELQLIRTRSNAASVILVTPPSTLTAAAQGQTTSDSMRHKQRLFSAFSTLVRHKVRLATSTARSVDNDSAALLQKAANDALLSLLASTTMAPTTHAVSDAEQGDAEEDGDRLTRGERRERERKKRKGKGVNTDMQRYMVGTGSLIVML